MDFLPEGSEDSRCESGAFDDKEDPQDAFSGVQGEGGFGCREGGEDAGQEKGEAKEGAVDMKALHAKIGELTLENDFLSGALSKAGLLGAKR